MTAVPIHERAGYVDASHMTHGLVTLDGRPAVIVGYMNDFAHVGVIDGYSIAANYSWHAVRRIMRDHNGAFQS